MGSPFDYRSHSLLYVARHLPDRRAAGAEEAMHEELAPAHRKRPVGAPWPSSPAAGPPRRPPRRWCPGLPYTLLIQGDLPKARLLEEFAEDETSCLFATLGFWQGVDIPGPALSLVTSTGCPSRAPTTRCSRPDATAPAANAFQLVDLPRAATMLAQGAGRLIRTAEDRGVVAVLDPRLATASYRGVLLSTLPPMRRSVDPEEVEVVPAPGARRVGLNFQAIDLGVKRAFR